MAKNKLGSAVSLLVSLARAVPQSWWPSQQPVCTDGGQLRCCAATFNGDNAPVELLTDLSCYDLTPATVNCILPGAGNLLGGLLGADGGCPSSAYQCCHIVLDPLIGLYCGPPPGPCQGPEAPPRCFDVLGGRFGHCPANPGTGRQVAAQFGNAAQENPLGLDLSGLLGGRDVDDLHKVEMIKDLKE